MTRNNLYLVNRIHFCSASGHSLINLSKSTAIAIIVVLCILLLPFSTARAAQFTVDGWKVEYWRNHPVGTPSNAYDRAVIVIHGIDRNANDHYERIVTAAQTENVLDNTLIIAPQFKISDDSPAVDELYWSSSGWKIGFKSTNGNRTPSFQVIDHLLGLVNDNFPYVTLVSIVGHSAGGQFVQRYGALNEMEPALRTEIDIRYIVANPSSYMYLTDDRPLSTTGCSNYDEYRYGISNLPETLSYTNLSQSSIGNQLTSRSLYILLGTQDTDPDSFNLDKSCMANAQGLNRFQRGTLYYDHIMEFGPGANHIKLEIEEVGHSSNGMFNSSKGRETIFDTGSETTHPDLLVISPSVTDANLTPDQFFTINATTKNQGTATANSTVLRYYQSTDATININDLQLTNDSVASLASGETSLESASLTAPSSAGTYWVGACVDAVTGESDTSNQCSSGVQIVVSSVPQGDKYELDNTSGLASIIQSGIPQSRSIIPASDQDWIKIILQVESDLTLETTGVSGDTLIWLFDENLSQIAFDDDGDGSDYFSKIDIADLSAGTYYAMIEEYHNDDEILSYTLTAKYLLSQEDDWLLTILPAIIANTKSLAPE